MKHGCRLIVSIGIACVLAAAGLRADTLVLRDGRRVEGRLVGIRDGVIEFEGRRGWLGGSERLRVDRSDVRRIELDDEDGERAGADEGDRGDDRARPSGMRERDVTVEARAAWTDTGIDIRAGQTIYFAATGKVRWGPGRQDGPSGEDSSHYNATRPMPGRPGAALIGRLGDHGDPFFIGDAQGPIRMRASGRLYLGVNDDYLQDNSGAFRVTVYF